MTSVKILADLGLLLAPAVLGAPFAWSWGAGRPASVSLGLAWFLGVAVSLPLLIGVGLLGVPYTGFVLLTCSAFPLVLGVAFARAQPSRPKVHELSAGGSAASWGILLLVAVNLIAIGCIAFRSPSIVWDVLKVWLPKAASLQPPSSLVGLNHASYADYPPLWPIHMGIVEEFQNQDAVVRLLPTIYLLCFLGIAYWYLSRRVGAVWAATGIWLISGIPNLCYLIGAFDLLAEVPTMALGCGAVLLLAEYMDHGEARDGVVAVALGVAALLARPEAFLFAFPIIGVVCVVAFRRRHIGLFVSGVLLPSTAYLVWHAAIGNTLHAKHAGYMGLFLHALKVVSASNAVFIGTYFTRIFFDPYRFGPTLIELGLVLAAWRAWRVWGAVVGFLALQIGTLGFVYLILPSIQPDIQWLLDTGFDRMLLHVAPLVPIAGVLAFHSLFPIRSPDSTTESPAIRDALGWAVLGALLLVGAGVYERQSRAADLSLTTVAPNQVENLYGPVTYAGNPGWWQTPADADAMMTHPVANQKARVRFLLINLGARGSSKTIMGRFTRFDTQVGLVKTNVGSVRFSVEIDGQKMAETSGVVTGLSGRLSLSTPIPPDARYIDLVVDPVGGNASDHAVWFSPHLVRGGSLPIAAVLLGIGGIASLYEAFTLLRRRDRPAGRRWRGAGIAATAIVLALILVQIDCVSNQLLRNWVR